MKGLLDFCETVLMAFICAHSCNSWLTEERPFHCELPGLHKERKNLTEKGLRLELVSNTTDITLLTEKTFKGNYPCGFNVQINE